MSISRRTLLQMGGLGAVQLGLLSRFGMLEGRATADCGPNRPTKLLTIFIKGGIYNELMWSIFHDDAISRFVPPPTEARTAFYDASMVTNLDGSGNADSDAEYRRVRVNPIWERDSNPATRGPGTKGQVWSPGGYGLFEHTVLLTGVDQGTAAHGSGRIASMCGVAGGSYAAPAIPATVAAFLLGRFPDRPVANVAIGDIVDGASLSLPAEAGPVAASSSRALEYPLADTRPMWNGLRTRREEPFFRFDGVAEGTIATSVVEAATLSAIRSRRGAGMDGALEQLYDQYAAHSRVVARDVVDAIVGTPGVEHLPMTMPWDPRGSRFGWRIGSADYSTPDVDYNPQFELVLKLLKSDSTTSVSLKLPSDFNFDTHNASRIEENAVHVRGAFESIGRLLAEMKMTPAPSGPAGATLLDETLVYITSDFGRTFAGIGNDDHNPIHTAVLVNGRIQGNRMIGGIADDGLGRPVSIIAEDGTLEARPPGARDVAATIYSCFGMESGADYFIPGGYGTIRGVTCE